LNSASICEFYGNIKGAISQLSSAFELLKPSGNEKALKLKTGKRLLEKLDSVQLIPEAVKVVQSMISFC